MTKLKDVHSPNLNSEGDQVLQTKVVPFTTKSGIQIGCMYQPKRHYPLSRDMELLQEALLGKPVKGIKNRFHLWMKRWVHHD